MNCLVPLSTQRLPWRLALVLIAAASEPAPGSVRQKQASISPAAIGLQKALLLLLRAEFKHRHATD